MTATEPARAAQPTVIDPSLLGEGCPTRRLLRLVGDKWTPIVLYCLSAGECRFGELHRLIPDISKKVLTQVLRTINAGNVPTTTYRLTETGHRLHEPVAMLCRWAEQNADVLAGYEPK